MRLEQNARPLRAAFTGLVHRLEVSPPVLTAGRGEAAEAVAAMGEAAAAARRLLGTSMRALSPWQVVAAVSHGRLLAVAAPARLSCTSRHLSVSDFLCAGLFAVRYRMFIRCPLFALSDVVVPVLCSGLVEPGIPLLPRADAACPGFRGVCCCPGRLLPDPLRIAWRAVPVCHLI